MHEVFVCGMPLHMGSDIGIFILLMREQGVEMSLSTPSETGLIGIKNPGSLCH